MLLDAYICWIQRDFCIRKVAKLGASAWRCNPTAVDGEWRQSPTPAHLRLVGGWWLTDIYVFYLHGYILYIYNIWLYPYLGWSRLTKVSNIKIRFLELFWCSTRILKSNRGVAWNANFDRVLHVGQIHKRSAHSTVSRATTWECWLNQQTLGFDGKKQGFFHDIATAPLTTSHGLAFEVVEILRQKVDRGWTALGKIHFPTDSEEMVIPWKSPFISMNHD